MSVPSPRRNMQDSSSGRKARLGSADVSDQENLERRIKRFRAKSEECRTSAEGMNHPTSRASLLRFADTYEKLAERLEARQLPCKVRARDNTGRELEILCDTVCMAQDVYADFCGRGYREV